MNTPLPALLSACVEWLVTLRPRHLIANLFKIEPGTLQAAIAEIAHPHSPRGSLENALAAPTERPDLIPIKTHLARLEHQLTVQAVQFERAEHRINSLSSKEGGCDDGAMFEAEKYSNKLSQQTVRLLKEIDKARKELQEATQQPLESETSPAKPKSKAQPKHPSHSTRQASLQVDAEKEVDKPAELGDGEAEVQEMSAPKEISESTLKDSLINPPPTEQEFLLCLVKNRDRIKAASPKDRQTLILRLIEDHRKKSTPRAA